MAAGVLDRLLDHQEVMEIGRRVEAQFSSLVKALVPLVAAEIVAI
jgi:purine-nucleoside phosphorylase